MPVQQDLRKPNQSKTKFTSMTEPTRKNLYPIRGNNNSVLQTDCIPMSYAYIVCIGNLMDKSTLWEKKCAATGNHTRQRGMPSGIKLTCMHSDRGIIFLPKQILQLPHWSALYRDVAEVWF